MTVQKAEPVWDVVVIANRFSSRSSYPAPIRLYLYPSVAILPCSSYPAVIRIHLYSSVANRLSYATP